MTSVACANLVLLVRLGSERPFGMGALPRFVGVRESREGFAARPNRSRDQRVPARIRPFAVPSVPLRYRPFAQFALQRAAVHAEQAGGGGDVAVGGH